MQIRRVKIYKYIYIYLEKIIHFLYFLSYTSTYPFNKKGKIEEDLENELVRKDITKCGVTDNMALQLSWKVELTKPILHRWIKVS